MFKLLPPADENSWTDVPFCFSTSDKIEINALLMTLTPVLSALIHKECVDIIYLNSLTVYNLKINTLKLLILFVCRVNDTALQMEGRPLLELCNYICLPVRNSFSKSSNCKYSIL